MLAVFKMEAIGDNYTAARKYGKDQPFKLWLRNMRLGDPRLEPWVDHIESMDAAGLVKRRMKPVRNYSVARRSGSRGVYLWYFLPPGYYEVQERTGWATAQRYFIHSENSEIAPVTREEIVRWLENDTSASTS